MNMLPFGLSNLSTLRNIPLRDPAPALRHFIAQSLTLVRTFDTPWRGPVVFTGAGFAWALAEVREIFPLAEPKDTAIPRGYLWCLDEVIYLPTPVPHYCEECPRLHFFQFERVEPVFASAGLCRDIEALYAPAVPELIPESAPLFEAALPQVLVAEAFTDLAAPPKQLSLF
jgi:hypothetical protein